MTRQVASQAGWMLLIASLLGLLVGIDGLLDGDLLRSLLGFAAFAFLFGLTFWGDTWIEKLSAKLKKR